MSTPQRKGTRIFGIQVTTDPKWIIAGLVAFAGFLFWYNSGSEDAPAAPVSTVATTNGVLPPPSAARSAVIQRKSGAPANDRSTLRLRAIDATRGDIDPTLRLELLARLARIQQSPASRSLFEIGAGPTAGVNQPRITGPVILPKTSPVLPPAVGPNPGGFSTAVNIPFKYYGYVKPSAPVSANKGLFLDGEDVLIASEGELVKKRFLVVELTPNSARLEDTQLKQGQTLPVIPVAAQ